jgi:hypothetical protein
VRRLALNFDQTSNLPPNTAKESDGRYFAYAQQFGTVSWELDALDPVFIVSLIRTELDGLIEQAAWADAAAAEETGRETLTKVSDNWATVEEMLGDR